MPSTLRIEAFLGEGGLRAGVPFGEASSFSAIDPGSFESSFLSHSSSIASSASEFKVLGFGGTGILFSPLGSS